MTTLDILARTLSDLILCGLLALGLVLSVGMLIVLRATPRDPLDDHEQRLFLAAYSEHRNTAAAKQHGDMRPADHGRPTTEVHGVRTTERRGGTLPPEMFV